ncbi:hypothetical protein DsansV1_C38g0234971 [Dioscorea sansibarensis]
MDRQPFYTCSIQMPKNAMEIILVNINTKRSNGTILMVICSPRGGKK